MDTERGPRRGPKPIIFWYGFPACALLLKRVADELKENVVICGTKDVVPYAYEELERMLGHRIVWLDTQDDIWERRNEFADRNLIIHSGWNSKGWRKYDRAMRKLTGAKAAILVDNRYRGDLRQRLGALWFRLFYRRIFDTAIVPGKEGRKLMKFLGLRQENIYTGLYGAYEGIYAETRPIEQRNKEFLFVGQLIRRKAVDILLEAFQNYRNAGGTWTLRFVGGGDMKDECQGDGVVCEPFSQPHLVAEKMNNARVLILPSRDDNWGTVVCEAAACGMHLITSKNVGASADIVRDGVNGIVLEHKTVSVDDIEKALFAYEKMPEERLREGSKISKEIASHFNSKALFETFKRIAGDMPGRRI